MEPEIRPARAGDHEDIARLLRAAFPTAGEARLAEALRSAGEAPVELVALLEDRVAGHLLCSPVTLAGARGLGLAPLAVAAEERRRGLGALLVRAGMAACRELQAPFVVVLGEPEYYGRFGFERASLRQVRNEYGVDEPFQLLELGAGGVPAGGGLARYAPQFAQLED